MTEQQRLELEAATFRRLLEHLQKRSDVQNIDLMNLAGFCRNCLSKWYKAAADERAKEVAKVASHTRPDGTNCFTVLKEYGVSDTATGENAAWGETTPEKVVADWMASEGHRVNIMDPAAKYMCLGYNYDANSQWGHNWIQIFAK